MHRSHDNWERLVDAVLRRERLWELFHAQSRSPSVLSVASGLSSSSLSNLSLDDFAKSTNPGLVFTDGFWPEFGLEDLLLASAEVLGKGMFGSVYCAKLDNGMTVVVKRLKLFSITDQDSKRLLGAVGDVRHPNVAPLRAYYTSIEEKLMLYDHHSCGSVSELLHGSNDKDGSPIDWETLLRIATGVARGISHIHSQNGGKLVHGNIKSSNIFLNLQQYGYVSDLGLPDLIPTTFMPTAWCYAPEVKSTLNVTQASDVYSFGILLLELLTGKSPVPTPCGHEAIDLVKLVNSVNCNEWYSKVSDRNLSLYPRINEEIVRILKVGLVCVAKSAEKRPKMSAVLKMIEDIHLMSFGYHNSMSQVLTDTERNKLEFFDYANHTFDRDDLFMAYTEVLRRGTFGTSYKVILENGTTIFVKRLRDVIVASKEFQQHVEHTGRMEHPNVAELRAYYYSNDEKLLIYDYFNQGSVSTMLHGNRSSRRIHIDWKTRLEIAVGAARGIAHIHTRNDRKLVHGNIRTSNIFLNEQRYALVSDVGLASLTSPIGLFALWKEEDCAPELIDTKLVSQASDVYSFGVVLLELVSGKSPQCTRYTDEGIPLVRWIMAVMRKEWFAEAFDLEILRYDNIEEGMVIMMQIAMDCVAKDPKSRPKMVDVVTRLEEISGSETVLS